MHGGHEIARCTVERLVPDGQHRNGPPKKAITTIPGQGARRAPDFVDPEFVAAAPNRR